MTVWQNSRAAKEPALVCYSPPKFQTKPDFEKAGNSTAICTQRKPVKLVLKIVFRMTCANVGIVLTTNQRSVWRHACAPCTDLLPCVVTMFLVFLADFRRAKLCCENQISILFYICQIGYFARTSEIFAVPIETRKDFVVSDFISCQKYTHTFAQLKIPTRFL